MGLDNYWYKKVFENQDSEDYSYDHDEYKLVSLKYEGEDLSYNRLEAGLRTFGWFRGKFYSDLFDALVEDGRFSLYSEDHLQQEDLQVIVSIMSWTKRHLLAEDGELWWASYAQEHLSESEFLDDYDYETVLSFIIMFEWYSEQENVVLSCSW